MEGDHDVSSATHINKAMCSLVPRSYRARHSELIINSKRAPDWSIVKQKLGYAGPTLAELDWPTRVTRVTLTWYPVDAAHAVPRE